MKKEYAPTKLALAKRLKLSRNTLDNYLILEGAPERGQKGWPIEDMIAFVASRAKSEATAYKTSDELRALKAKELTLKCERLQFELERDRGEWISVEDFRRDGVRCFTAMRVYLESWANSMPPILAGLQTPAEVAKVIRPELRNVLTMLADGDWKKYLPPGTLPDNEE